MGLDSSGIMTSVKLSMTAEMWITVDVLPLAYLLYWFFLGYRWLSFPRYWAQPPIPKSSLSVWLVPTIILHFQINMYTLFYLLGGTKRCLLRGAVNWSPCWLITTCLVSVFRSELTNSELSVHISYDQDDLNLSQVFQLGMTKDRALKVSF